MSGRHLLSLPRGRGPSQTPKFLSPGPPSPWLPALFTRAASQLPRSRRVLERYPSPASQGAKPHSGHLLGRLCKCRKRFNARGCKGRSPLHKITLSPPLPRGGRGSGGWGQTNKLKAVAAGDQKGKPPLGHHSGRDSQCRAEGQRGASPPPSPCQQLGPFRNHSPFWRTK